MKNNQLTNLLTFIVVFLIGLIIGLLLFKRCDNTITRENKPITVIKHSRDTIWAKDTLYKFKSIKVPVKIKVTDTIYKVLPVDSSACNTVSLYKDSLIDSNIVIYYKDYIQGVLRSKDMSYKLKVPLRIIDSIKTKETITIKPKFNISLGSIVGVNMIAPGIKVRYKRNEFGINYNIISPIPQNGIMVHWKYILIEK